MITERRAAENPRRCSKLGAAKGKFEVAPGRRQDFHGAVSLGPRIPWRLPKTIERPNEIEAGGEGLRPANTSLD